MQAIDSLQSLAEGDVDTGRPSYSDDVLTAVDNGRKIEAIKRLREETGLGLKEAKHAIDALVRERQGNPAVNSTMPEEGGAGSAIKIVILIVAVLAVYFYFFAP